MYITLLVPSQLTAEINVNSAKVRVRFSYTDRFWYSFWLLLAQKLVYVENKNYKIQKSEEKKIKIVIAILINL